MLMKMRGIAAALMTLELGLVVAYAVLHALVAAAGGDPFSPRQGLLYFLVALVLALPGAAAAGFAAVREAASPDRRLLTVAALGAALSAVTWALFRFDYGVGFQGTAEDADLLVVEALRQGAAVRHGVGVPMFVNIHEPPFWFLLVLPLAVAAVVTAAGRLALRRRGAEAEEAEEDREE